MKLLLDTHTFLWSIGDDPRLSPVARQHIADPSNELFISIASLWEATIKIATGKMRVPGDTVDYLLNRTMQAGTNILPILPTHLQHLQGLQMLHRDPFDRILIAHPWLSICRLSRLMLNSDDTKSRFSIDVRGTVAEG